MSRNILMLTIALWSSALATAGPSQISIRPVEFTEVWAYLLSGEEAFLSSSYPISDLCYFGAGINSYGELVGVPDPGNLSSFGGRKHLVVAETSSLALSHFCLDPAYPVRDRLVAEIVAAAAGYDGVQIDFEAIPSRDRDNFAGFLALLKMALGHKSLSVALPARLSAAGDTLGYARLAKIVDKVLIMAYDQHWSTSEPGPVASLDWCEDVVAYASSEIPAAKLVMGIPFYGRSWTDKKLAKAFKHSAVASLSAEKEIDAPFRDGEIPHFNYEEVVSVIVYYDDATSITARMRLYRESGINAVAFWRLGQEDPEVWERLRSK